MIRAVLWDIDNTLLDFDVAEKAALKTNFSEFGLGVFTNEMLKDYMALNKRRWQALEKGEMEKQEVLEGRFKELFGLYGIKYNEDVPAAFNDRYQELLGDTICYRDESYEIVKKLKDKVLLAIASNGTKKAQTGKLNNSGFDKLFDLFFISEEIGAEKPSIDFFEVAIKEADNWLTKNEPYMPYSDGKYMGKLKADEIIMIGDSLTSDMVGAQNAGIHGCWYNPNGISNTLGIKVDYEIKDLHDVMSILNL